GKLADLEGRRIALRRSSSFWKTIETVRLKHPRIKLQVVPEEVDTEAILHRVATGAYDVTVADSNLVEEVFAYRNDLRVAFDITRNRLIAWGVRP
ncbi:MAG: transporter substrate-binding domain-containing protein, partial [Burkholderiales bacterium]|nr:transporter substrate-binding domain-containing protein [Burkholderiales bacterium]